MAAARLEEYARRRDFERTAEPPADVGVGGGFRYVMQKHAARRLHYDLRLELDGVLLSWAVTKGPSVVARRRRLAVRTEDHPLDYAGFEGTIPAGEYGAGAVMLWDQGHWEPIDEDPRRALEAGKLRFRLHGQRLSGAWTLARMARKPGEKRENWLLLKRKDDAAEACDDRLEAFETSVSSGRSMAEIAAAKASEELPAFVPPALATLVTEAPAGEGWLHEIKHDGYRIQAAIAGGRVRIRTRSGEDWTERFGVLAAAFARLPVQRAVLDGEAIARDEAGHASFQALRSALTNGAAIEAYLFDLLEHDGEDLRQQPLRERKEKLARILAEPPDGLRYSDHILGQGPRVAKHACRIGAEGIIAKRADAPYRSGRSKSWLKVKCPREGWARVIGWSPSTARGRPFASLLLATPGEDGTLTYAGRVGSGFDEGGLAEVEAALLPRQRPTPPVADVPRAMAKGATWFEPNFCAHLRFTEVTNDGAFRHPVFLGFEPLRRPPKRPRMSAAAPVRLTSPDKLLFPDAGLTKADVADYYGWIAPRLLQHLAGRPVSLVRCPGGRHGPCFFQKHLGDGMPEVLRPVAIAEKDGGTADYIVVEAGADLRPAAQIAVLEWHVWGCRVDDVEHPDRMVLDLDPGPGVTFENVGQAAQEIRDLLDTVGLRAFPLVTGGKGVHVVTPLQPHADWSALRTFARSLAYGLARAEPARFVAKAAKSARQGRIFLDWMRNGRGATAIAPYSLRARPGAPIATPVTWPELLRLERADGFDVGELRRRLARQRKDPWAGYDAAARPLPPAPPKPPAISRR